MSSDPSFPTIRRVERIRHELRVRELKVRHVEHRDDGFAVIVLGGEALEGFVSSSFDDHVKVMIPGADGTVARRDFTPRRFDPVRQNLTIEFLLHGHGPASDWARQAAPGQSLAVGGPRGSMVIASDFDWYLLGGDASALPAIRRCLEELPQEAQALVLVEEPVSGVQPVLATQAHADVRWVPDGATWLDALATLDLPSGEGFAWCAGEAGIMPRAQDVLVTQHGMAKEQMRVSAYWKSA